MVTHAKYVNCRNHRLALVFVYSISIFQVLADVDALILAVWKLMKYSSVKASVFGAAQTVEGQKNVKLLKTAPTCWLSHGDALQRLVSRFEPLVNCLDTLITDSRAPDVKGVWDKLLEPNTILILLLLADVLVHVNQFSQYLQTRNMIFAMLMPKFGRLVESMQHLAENDGPSFSEHAVQFLTVAKERMALARRLRGREDVLEEDEADRINCLHQQIKAPFMNALIEELQNALQINDPVFLAFDVLNVTTKYSFQERIEHINILAKYYGSSKTSKVGDSTITAPPNLSNEAVDEQTAKTFFTDFDDSVKREEDCRNKEIRMLVSSGKLKANQVESYRDNHPVALNKVYADLIVDKELYLDLVNC